MAVMAPSRGWLWMLGDKRVAFRPSAPRCKRVTCGRPSTPYVNANTSPGYIRWGFCTWGLTYQISGHSQGSRRNLEEIVHRVSPLTTVYFCGAFSASAGAGVVAGACSGAVAVEELS